MSAAAYPSRIAGRHARRGHDALLVRVLVLLAVGVVLLAVGFVIAGSLGGKTTPPIRSQEPAVTTPTQSP